MARSLRMEYPVAFYHVMASGKRRGPILVLVDGKTAGYYETLLDDIHFNPARAGLIRGSEGQSLMDYPWCSAAGGYLILLKNRPKWLAAAEGLATLGLPATVSGRRQFVERLDRRAVAESLPGMDRPAARNVQRRKCCSHPPQIGKAGFEASA